MRACEWLGDHEFFVLYKYVCEGLYVSFHFRFALINVRLNVNVGYFLV